MEIKLLRKIGRRLLKEIPSMRLKPKTAIGIGAAGDTTYLVDKRAEEIVVSGLEKSGEALTIISEEIGIKEIKGGGKRVLVDPVDGSRNAISGIPFYCTSIAVADGDTLGDIESAYVVNLISGDEFWVEKGKGAFLNGEKIHTQIDDELYLIAYEAQHPSNDIPKITPLLVKSRKTRCLGATALDLAYLAFGAISIFVTQSLSRSFDFASGWLLVREAGGIFTDIKGNSIENLETSLKRSSSLLAAGNEKLHEKALRLLNRTSGKP
ncbi:MAG TPA: inositol monophosphatase family protein [Thermodesulfovibrionales bacterium]|nr:inositol monophosphatase family protein [Thermodesulfovibrionales bacterium]